MHKNIREANTVLFGTSESMSSHRNNTELGKDKVWSWTLNSCLTTYGLMETVYLPQ